MKPIKAVCVIYYDYHIRKSDKRLIPHALTVVRSVHNPIKIKEYVGLPYKFFENSSHLWADDKIWSLWSGEIKFEGQSLIVKGWAFTKSPPFYWGGSLITQIYYNPPDRIALWGWLELSDFPEWGRYIDPKHTTAARKISKYLKAKEDKK